METPVAYAVCCVADIPNRRARGFSLLRADPDGSAGGVPFHIVIIRWDRKLYGYVNRCPHQVGNLDWEQGQFFDPGGTHLMCGKHGALFEVDTGACVEGPCAGAALEPLPLVVLDGDVCVAGMTLIEDISTAA